MDVRCFRFLSSLALVGLALLPNAALGQVHLNQIGYRPGDPKWVAVEGPATTFDVVRVSDDAVVLSGPLTLRRASDPASGDDVLEGDFTAVMDAGRYYVSVTGTGVSPAFDINDGIYDDLFRQLLKGLFYQRCGTAVLPAHGGTYTHDPCHLGAGGEASYDWASTGGVPSGYRDTRGGWHDAGDYGKYTTNNAYAVGVLLRAYSQFPDKYQFDDCGIPESGNAVPDLLDEARWSLAWMLRMQDADGGVRHRESVATWSGEFTPENDLDTRYYTGVSSDATASHAAAMALAARIYTTFDPAFADTCDSSAVRAWAWLEANPARVPAGGFVNQYGHTGATYVGSEDVGHRIWAAAEVLSLNGNPGAKAYVDAHWGDGLDFNGVWYPDDWGAQANLGAFAYRDALGATPGVVSGNWWSVENSTLSSCATWSTRVDQDGYGCAATTSDYYWGFTGVILRYAWTLLQGHRYDGTPAYANAAREQLHYILGRNPMGKVYLTGLGANPVLHAHGAWNLAAGFVDVSDALCHPVPYQLVGGPNAADNGGISAFPARCYEDIADPSYFNKGNWTLNESAVNIQASLLALVGYFSSGGTVSSVGPSQPSARLILGAPTPNPSRGSTTIAWSVPRRENLERLTLRLYTVQGRVLRTWDLGRDVGTSGSLTWDGRDGRGRLVPAGLYLLGTGEAASSARILRLQ